MYDCSLANQKRQPDHSSPADLLSHIKDQVSLLDHLSHKVNCVLSEPYFYIIHYEFRDFDDLNDLTDSKVRKVSCFPLAS